MAALGGALHALWCLESGFSLYSRLQIDFLVTDGYRFLRHWILLCLLVLQEHWPQLTTPEGGGSCHLGKLSGVLRLLFESCLGMALQYYLFYVQLGGVGTSCQRPLAKSPVLMRKDAAQHLLCAAG